jgi:hypothetical protein
MRFGPDFLYIALQDNVRVHLPTSQLVCEGTLEPIVIVVKPALDASDGEDPHANISFEDSWIAVSSGIGDS